MAIGGFFKALGKGARAVGRGAMKGVLGFDDRDVTAKFKKRPGALNDLDFDPNEPDEDEGVTSKYSGFSKGAADIGSNDPGRPMKAHDEMGNEAGGFEMEAPPTTEMTGMESLIGLEMPGFKKKGGMGKPAMRTGGGVKIEAPKTMPTAYETVTAGAAGVKEVPGGYYPPTPELKIPGIRAMRGSITGDVNNLRELELDHSGMGDTPEADPWGQKKARQMTAGHTGFLGESLSDHFDESEGLARGTKDMIIGEATGAGLGVAGQALKQIPGLVSRAPGVSKATGKFLDWARKGNPNYPAGYSRSPGMRVPGAPTPAPQSGPGKAEIDKLLGPSREAARLRQMRYPEPAGPMEKPFPGLGGVEGPMPPLPPGLQETSMEVLYSPLTKSLKRIPR